MKRSKFLENWVPSAKAETARRVISLAETADPGNTAASTAAAARPTMRMISPFTALAFEGYRLSPIVAGTSGLVNFRRSHAERPSGGWNEADALRHDHGRCTGAGG